MYPATGYKKCPICGATRSLAINVLPSSPIPIVMGPQPPPPPAPAPPFVFNPVTTHTLGTLKMLGGGFKAIGSDIKKTFKNNLVTLVLLILAATYIGFIGTPAIRALGLPSIKAFWLGMALFFYAFYLVMPSPQKILENARMGANWRCTYQQPIQLGGQPCPGAYNYISKASNPPKCSGAGGIHHDEMAMSPQNTSLDLSEAQLGPLYVRSFVKILAISFAAIEFSPLSSFPFKNILIPLVFLFVAYFSMPTSYKSSQPYKATEAWFRMLLGIFLAAVMMTFLTPNASTQFTVPFIVSLIVILLFVIFFAAVLIVGARTNRTITYLVLVLGIIAVVSMGLGNLFGPPSVGAFYLMLAFFVTMPERKEPEQGDEGVSLLLSSKSQSLRNLFERLREGGDVAGNMIFLTFAMVGGIPLLAAFSSGGSISVAFGIVWIFSLLMGWTSGREARPYIGSIVMVLVVISFAFIFPATIGTSIFGLYWSGIENTATVFFGPIGDQLNKGSCEASANYQCIISGPIACSEAKKACQARSSEAEGSDRSIEITSFTAVPKEIGYGSSSNIPNTTAYLTIENTGDYDAKDVTFTVLGSSDPNQKCYPNVSYIMDGKERYQCIGDTSVEACIGGDKTDDNTCQWKGTFRKGSKGAVNFVIDWTVNNTPRFPLKGSTELEAYYGRYPVIGMKTQFDYEVNSQYGVNVLSSTEMTKRLLEGQDIPTATSKYTGGPIIAGISTSQYVESGKPTVVTASLTNNKEGTATEAHYCIYVPKDAGTPVIPSEEFMIDTEGNQVTIPSDTYVRDAHDCPAVTGMNAVECKWDTIESVNNVVTKTSNNKEYTRVANYGMCTFRITPDIGGAPQKQLIMTGKAWFTYNIMYLRKDLPFVG